MAGYKALNHPQQVAKRGSRPEVDDRATDPAVFAWLHARFGFTVDAAASEGNARLPRFWTAADDALAQPWAGERIWCNPPYSSPNLSVWTDKARAEHAAGCPLIVMIVPANRTDQGWWQRNVEPHRDRGSGLRTEFLPGRIRFIAPGRDRIGPHERPTFGCVLLIWEQAS